MRSQVGYVELRKFCGEVAGKLRKFCGRHAACTINNAEQLINTLVSLKMTNSEFGQEESSKFVSGRVFDL
jgi:hypothetical protein